MKIMSLLKSAVNVTKSCLAVSLLVAAGAVSAYGQGQIATGTIQGSGTGPYTYSLVFSDAPGATGDIGSVWYAWVPGFFYLPGTPTSASAPAGWTATISGNSVQYVASAPADYITPGHSLAGFGYMASFSPAQLSAAPNSGMSVAYSAGLFSDAGNTFNVTMVPEPAPALLLVFGIASAWLLRRRHGALA